MNNTLIEYVRVKRGPQKGQPRGVVAAVNGNIGWSYVNIGAGDTFDKARGIEIALARCEMEPKRHFRIASKQVPHEVKPVLARMELRAAKYFKQVNA